MTDPLIIQEAYLDDTERPEHAKCQKDRPYDQSIYDFFPKGDEGVGTIQAR